MDLVFVILVGVVAIAVVTALAQRLGVAGPILLVALGLVIGVMPFVHVPEIQPEWILAGVLPPLLFSAAVNLPAIEFRRDFSSISGLAVVLVVISSLVLGLFFWLVIPSVGLPLGIALGAILSPTDAVATSIVRRLGISPRVVTMLEGESLLNDATALVLLRTATIAIAGSFSLLHGIGAFAWGTLLAIVVGGIVGWLILRLRTWIGNTAANTAISYTVPFLAYFPTERLGGSGLVAAVVAGIVIGQGARRRLTPEQRMSDSLNWRTVELVLEGAVFLLMGLELKDIVASNFRDHEGLWFPIGVAFIALAIIVAVRAGYVAMLVWAQARRTARQDRASLEKVEQRIGKVSSGELPASGGPRDTRFPERREKRLDWMRTRVTRAIADLDYYQSSPLSWRHGAVIVWAGMRGVVTLAAAQTLTGPQTANHRALLIFIAFLVAFISLVLQGFTLPWLVRLLGLAGTGGDVVSAAERSRMESELWEAAQKAVTAPDLTMRSGELFPEDVRAKMLSRINATTDDEGEQAARAFGELRLVVIDAMRRRLNELSSDGAFSSAALRRQLAELDADQLSLELRLGDP